MPRFILELRRKLRIGQQFVSDVVLILLTLQCIMYSSVGLWILLQRQKGSSITEQEFQLIALFVGVNGVAFILRPKKEKKEEDVQC